MKAGSKRRPVLVVFAGGRGSEIGAWRQGHAKGHARLRAATRRRLVPAPRKTLLGKRVSLLKICPCIQYYLHDKNINVSVMSRYERWEKWRVGANAHYIRFDGAGEQQVTLKRSTCAKNAGFLAASLY